MNWTEITTQRSDLSSRPELFQLAVSLGAVESLIEQPASMSHASYDEADRKKFGIDDGLIRLSVGLEATNDLVDDLESAFCKCVSEGLTRVGRIDSFV